MARSRARRRPVMVLVLALATAASLTACGTGVPDHVRLGVIAPLSGPRAFLGTELVNGVRLAIDRINDDGGLLGRDVELVVTDDADLVELPGQLAELAERLHVSAVIGPEAPGILLGPRSPLTRRKVPAVLPSAFSGDLGQSQTVVVRTVPSARAQAEALGTWLRGVRETSEVAVLVADPIEGSAATAALEAGFAAAGVDVTAVLEAEGDAAQLGPAVAALRRDAGDDGAVLLWGPPQQTARATLAARELDWDVQLMVPSGSFVAEYRSLVRDASEGVVLPFPFRWEWFEQPQLTRWLLDYYSAYGLGALPQLQTLVLDVPVVAAAADDAVTLIAAAVAEAGTRDPEAVGDALAGATHEGLLRRYVMDDPEAWAPADLYIARFHGLATVFDVDPRLDPQRQRGFWERQVAADFLPESVFEGPAGALIRELIASRQPFVPTYEPPLPPPGPVGRPSGRPS